MIWQLPETILLETYLSKDKTIYDLVATKDHFVKNILE